MPPAKKARHNGLDQLDNHGWGFGSRANEKEQSSQTFVSKFGELELVQVLVLARSRLADCRSGESVPIEHLSWRIGPNQLHNRNSTLKRHTFQPDTHMVRRERKEMECFPRVRWTGISDSRSDVSIIGKQCQKLVHGQSIHDQLAAEHHED